MEHRKTRKETNESANFCFPQPFTEESKTKWSSVFVMAHWNCNVPPPGFGLWNVPPPSLPPLPPLPPQPPQPPQPREDQTAPPSASMLGLNAAQLEWIRRCRQRVPDQQFLDGFLASRIRPEPLPPPATVKVESDRL